MTTLDELRRANLQEQRRSAQTSAPAAKPDAPAGPEAGYPSPNLSPVGKGLPESIATTTAAVIEPETLPAAKPPAKPTEELVMTSPAPPPAAAAAQSAEATRVFTAPPVPVAAVDPVGARPSAAAKEVASEQTPSVVLAAAGAGEPEIDPQTVKARAMLDRFNKSISRKVMHQTGVKATVDMPPEVFWRVKRYCHDHNNVTVRQLFLDLVIAMLDEEGY